jgi:hypothetical protein
MHGLFCKPQKQIRAALKKTAKMTARRKSSEWSALKNQLRRYRVRCLPQKILLRYR